MYFVLHPDWILIGWQDILLDELSSQLKNMLHENSQLVIANDKLYNENQRIAPMKEKNEKLVASGQKSAAYVRGKSVSI